MASGDLSQLTDRRLILRFAKSHDERAFAELVSRHGDLVQRVCRRILRKQQDAEDAFQAVFLVLAKKGRQVRWQSSLANWLYGVAYRVALKASRQVQRRREQELEDAEMIVDDSLDDVASYDAQRALDEELNRLPDRYRAVVVLCCLEGKTRKQAASELAVSEMTVKGRLERARRTLRLRLTMRGLTLPVVLVGAGITAPVAEAALTATLSATTVQAAAAFTAGQSGGAAAVGQAINNLIQGELGNMYFTTQIKLAVAALLLVAVAGLGTLLVSQKTLAEDPKHEPENIQTIVVDGSAVDTDDRTDRDVVAFVLFNEEKDPRKQLIGVWKFVSAVDGGDVLPREKTDPAELVITDKKVVLRGIPGEDETKWDFEIDPTKTPKMIDLKTDDYTVFGIYEIVSGKLKICFNEDPNGQRPTKFFTGDGQSSCILFELKREKKKNQQNGNKRQAVKIRQQLQGIWKIVSAQDSGNQPAPAKLLEDASMVFIKEELVLYLGGDVELSGRFKLGIDKTPYTLDVLRRDGKLRNPCIFKLEDEKLTICVNEVPERGRPKKFASEKNSANDLLIVLRRAK